jgi:hypothetical protein
MRSWWSFLILSFGRQGKVDAVRAFKNRTTYLFAELK